MESNVKIIGNAIEKARNNGFHIGDYGVQARHGYRTDMRKSAEEPYILQYKGSERVYIREIAYQVIIFNHDFAKALWGEEVWEFHLQEMVIADDPIKYLGENI